MKEAMNQWVCKMIWLAWMAAGTAVVGGAEMATQTGGGDNDALFVLPAGVHTRWASAENWDAQPGSAGKENFGRKGSPCRRPLKAGESFVMAHAENTSGIVRRMWITIDDRTPALMRGIVLRMYWDGAEKPAVEVPLGDFFCQALGRPVEFENAWFDNAEGRSFACRIPMPFRKSFRITATNESDKDASMFFYDVNFTVGDRQGPDMGYFHSHFRRENPTTLRRDFEILPKVEGRGRFLGCTLGAIANTRAYGQSWWGEGEVKMYLDGDRENPTLCGTGTEDYIATGWGQGRYSKMWHGCPLADDKSMRFGFYRLHGPDPVYFHKDIRVTIQQLGWSEKAMADQMKKSGLEYLILAGDGNRKVSVQEVANSQNGFLFERQDDWCATTYFYLDKPANKLPAIPPYAERIAGLMND